VQPPEVVIRRAGAFRRRPRRRGTGLGTDRIHIVDLVCPWTPPDLSLLVFVGLVRYGRAAAAGNDGPDQGGSRNDYAKDPATCRAPGLVLWASAALPDFRTSPRSARAARARNAVILRVRL